MAPRLEELRVEAQAFQEMLKLAFAQKRKTLANNLKAQYPEKEVSAAMKAAGARSDSRAEALSLEQMSAVYRALRKA